MAITDWPENERPREKLLARGAAALSDAELLAIFLRVGVRGMSAVDLARSLITRFGSLTRMCSAHAGDFTAVPGMGLAKYAQLQAAMELARRALTETLGERTLFDSPQVVRDWLRLRLGHLPHETFCVMLLDARHCLIEAIDLFRGTLTQTSVYPREVVKIALSHNAAAVIFAHNHPSGAAEPSSADELLTRTLKDALGLVDIRVLDHFVVPAHGAPVSFAERGLL
ncbi:RadC family protein [Thauera chlorobenzoica]|uniref:DNA repair protein RadC n=1 Tax=Thauera chlorobenzoica TaxID=96773 RepID=A0A1H5TQ81_9RHOO|nr:DNA repair protein RadC [Thauera chlorobenzoica]APR06049.1 DNA repair protein RadC [Thauera chlorobenzoica]SEF64933.1 DNA replication and repair protein RadC [Thauera chlorobenzoica]